MQQSSGRLSLAFPLVVLLAVVACAAPHGEAPAAGGATVVEGTVAAIDTAPWAYDGHARVELDVPGRGPVVVQLPARWNLCKAAPVEVDALAPGMRVRAAGGLEEDGRLTVCADPAHGLSPL